jgi:hypothetical protein
MAKWDAALYTERLVKQSSLKKAWTPYTLNDGTSTGYGYGWAVSHYQDHDFITHAGGINGFSNDAFRFPNEQVYVCILTNCMRMIPNEMGFKVGALAAGRPYEEPAGIPFDPADYDRYLGVYSSPLNNTDVPIVREGDKLLVILPSGKEELAPLSKTLFASKQSTYRFHFTLDETGRARSVRMVGFYGPGTLRELTGRPLPEEPAQSR